MTRVKIAITIPEELLAQVKVAVAKGEAASVSAYISDAVASHSERRDLSTYLEALNARFGEPSPEAYAWADEQLQPADGAPPAKRRISRSTRAR
jgi:Arc/MetJ-type ribon-helix-helix transcriptional regulator